ncbi:MAG: biopolymer transporter ExbD [Planctomycetota bacterium]|nr:biopolymer transporter ExbD [Planctomycetota bacterium]
MKIQTTEDRNVKLNMTSMIDIVFQLLVFFIMTFKIVEMEGDFNVRMPLAAKESTSIEDVLPDLITVKLKVGAEGKIAGIDVDNGVEGDTYFDADMYSRLTDFVEKTIDAEGDPSEAIETEVEFDIDFDLKYSYTVQAIESVSGKIVDGQVKKLIEKIKFKDNSDQSE